MTSGADLRPSVPVATPPASARRPAAHEAPVRAATPVRPGRLLVVGMGVVGDQPGGLNRYVAAFHAAMDAERRGFIATLAASDTDDLDPGWLVGARRTMPALTRALRMNAVGALRARRADVLDVHFSLYAPGPVLMARLLRRPIIAHWHGPWGAESRALGGRAGLGPLVKKHLERFVYRSAGHVIVLSSAFERLLIETHGIAPEKVLLLPPGVDLDRFAPTSAPAGVAGPLTAPKAVAVRRLVPRMGLEILLDAWGLVAAVHPGALLTIVGDGPERARLEALARGACPPGAIHFAGKVSDEDVRRLYAEADVSVVPTTSLEGFGLVILESLACGTPVVASDVGGIRDALAGLQEDLLVPPGSPELLASRLLDGMDGLRPLPTREACRAYASGFSWPTLASRTWALVDDTMRPRTPAATTSRPRHRILVLDHVSQLGGGQIALLRLLSAAHARVDPVLVLGGEGPYAERARAAGFEVRILDFETVGRRKLNDVRPMADAVRFGPRALGLVHDLRVLIRTSGAEAVYTNSMKAHVIGGLAARRAHVPWICHVRDILAPPYLSESVRRALGVFFERVHPTAVIGNSAATVAALPGSGLERHIVYSGLDFDPAQAPWPDAPGPRLGLLGRIDAWKGQDVAIRALPLLQREFPGIHLVIGGDASQGDPAYARRLHELVRDNGLEDAVTFGGWIEDPADFYAGVHLALHTSVYPEPFGQVIVEALACGREIVCTSGGGADEIVTGCEAASSIAPGDPVALADAIRSRLLDGPPSPRLVEAALSRARLFRSAVSALSLDAILTRHLGLRVSA